MSDWKRRYLEMLTGDRGKFSDDVRNAFSFKCEHLPKFLYRYRSISQHSLSEIRSGKIWLSSPLEFNDPFDSYFTTSNYALPTKELLKILSSPPRIFTDEDLAILQDSANQPEALFEMFLKKEAEKTNAEVESIRESYMKAYWAGREVGFKDILDVFRSGIGVACFTELPDNILMWSHYADNHQGICLEYRVSYPEPKNDFDRCRDAYFHINTHPVVYTDSMADYSYKLFSDAEFSIRDMIVAACTKSRSWEYEKEWRLINNQEKKSPQLPFRRPHRVILGARISDENLQKVRSACKSMKIPTAKASLSGREFDLTIS